MNMRDKFIRFILERAANEAVSVRAHVYRETAKLLDSRNESQELLTLAEELEAIERRSHQLLFQFPPFDK
jgi:hypothetical protein